MSNVIKARIGDVICDVVPFAEYAANTSLYDPYYTVIDQGNGYLYPIRKHGDYRPGMEDATVMVFWKDPIGSEVGMYNKDNIINFDEAQNLREIIHCQQRLASEERSILTTINNQYVPEIGENDTPEMQALKQCISDKHIDLDQYEHRFGPNYNNDKRLLRKDSITFSKLRTMCNALDIRAYLTLEDANPDVPNPIGRSVTVDLTGPGMSLNEGEE